MLFLCNIPSILRVFSLKTSLCSYLLRFLLQEHKLVKDLTTFIGDCLCYFQCIKSSVNIEKMFLFTFKWALEISMLSSNLVCISHLVYSVLPWTSRGLVTQECDQPCLNTQVYMCAVRVCFRHTAESNYHKFLIAGSQHFLKTKICFQINKWAKSGNNLFKGGVW